MTSATDSMYNNMYYTTGSTSDFIRVNFYNSNYKEFTQKYTHRYDENIFKTKLISNFNNILLF